MKKISIITPTYNEEENIFPLVESVFEVIKKQKNYLFEHLIIDNASEDSTQDRIKKIIESMPHVGLIINNRNFGQIRSPFHALVTSNADAVIIICADLQDPPEMISEFIKFWEEGAKVVAGVKKKSKENIILFNIRKLYYWLLKSLSDHNLISNWNGFGLIDKEVLLEFKKVKDTFPYFRGLISDLGYDIKEVSYEQNIRLRGKSKNNFLSLFDYAVVGMTSNSKMPIRAATLLGMIFSFFSLAVGLFYFIFKIIYWDSFQLGVAPVIILFSLGMSLVIFFLGIIGEYIGSIHAEVISRPRVIEKKRINYPVSKELNKS
tara:strand:+ start:3874 stop:4830 length:957 start_codon:yes stop_codon:yes gene_type:complete